MREILFRGKHIGDGEWIYGVPVSNDFVTCIFKLMDDISEQRGFEVYPETVGQFTGLYDKNGTKIFEGDICKYRFDYNPTDETGTKERMGRVFWHEMQASWAIYSSPEEFVSNDLFQYIEYGNTVEVIGNIHDMNC